MRARSRLLLGFGGVAALIVIASQLARLGHAWTDTDRRVSTFVSGPGGASALYEALGALGVEVRRVRQRDLSDVVSDSTGWSAVALLAPARPPTAAEARALVALNDRRDGAALVVAGVTSAQVLRCFGYGVRLFFFDSVAIDRGADAARTAGAWAHALLVPLPPDSLRATPSLMVTLPVCPPGGVRTNADTLLASEAGAIALRLSRPARPDVFVVSDEDLFRNRTLRGGDTWAPGLLARRFRRVAFDEYHQGWGSSGSLARAVVAWSLRSPAGWGVWQVVVAGVLALLAGAIRFGPARAEVTRRRRASVEHVRALATALSAARGHGVAAGLLVQGLRRRLAPRGRQTRESWKEWLDRLSRRTTTSRSRAAVERLQTLVARPRDERAVLDIANAVEDVWDSLRPPTATRSRN